MTSVLGAIGNTVYYGLDAAARITKDMDAASQAARTCSTFLTYANLNVGHEEMVLHHLLTSINVVVEFSIVRNWVLNTKMLVTGEAAGRDDASRIYVDDDIYIPNFLRVASTSCFLVSDFLSTIKWFDTLELLNLAKISTAIGSIPVLGMLVTSVTFDAVRNTFGITGCVIDIVDAVRDMIQNGPTWYNSLQVIGDVARIAGIALIGASGHLVIIALVANGTASLCFIARFLLTSYGAPNGAHSGAHLCTDHDHLQDVQASISDAGDGECCPH